MPLACKASALPFELHPRYDKFLFMMLYVSTSVSITPSGQQVAAALAHSITRRAYHPFGPIESIVSRLTHGLDGPIRHLFLSLETKSPSFFFG